MYGSSSGYGNKQGSGHSYTQDYRQETVPSYNGQQQQGGNFGNGGENSRGVVSSFGGNNRQGSCSAYEHNYSGPTEGQPGPWQVLCSTYLVFHYFLDDLFDLVS